MCGIAGFINPKGVAARKEIILDMAKKISHRGPDSQGYFVEKNLAIGVRRLSIIDIDSGTQPIFSENKKILVVFNGEIYNFKILRQELVKKGHKFKTKSDTEVIVHLYEEEKESLFSHLIGMFAVAIWDGEEKKLVLARDRFGEKPLYYGKFGETFIFGSELKSVLAHPQVKKNIDFDSLARYLTFEYLPVPDSIFKNIKKLSPGSYLIFKTGKIQIKKYWDIKFVNFGKASDKEILEKLENILEESVKIQLTADVPVGVFLSGGIDSTTISYFAAKNSRKRLKSFTIGFEEESFDESQFAHQAASFLGLEHNFQIFKTDDLLNLIPEVTKFLDEPFADASILPTFLLSKFAKQKVKVALGGDGGDELFLGYQTFQAHKLASIYTKLPKLVHYKLIQPIVELLPTSYSNFSFDFKAKKFITGVYENPLTRSQIWLGSFNFPTLRKLLTKQVLAETETLNPISSWFNLENSKLQQLDNWQAIIYQYLTTYLTDDILVKTDRASMANSLEVRAPFLDFRLANFVNSLPVNLKLKGFTTKYILKKLMAGKLPSEIVNRPKHGFGVPIASWFRNELKNFLLETLAPVKIKKQGIFNPRFVNRLVLEHLEGGKDNRKLLWTLIMFQLWCENWVN